MKRASLASMNKLIFQQQDTRHSIFRLEKALGWSGKKKPEADRLQPFSKPKNIQEMDGPLYEMSPFLKGKSTFLVIISAVVMAVTWSIGRCQEEPCWTWGILSEIHSAAPSSTAPIPPGSTLQGQSHCQHHGCREEALEPGAGAGGVDPAGVHVQSNLVKQHASAGSDTPCASPPCVIWHARCQITHRSWDVGMHSQVMIPSGLLPSHVMQLPRSLAVPDFWQFRGLQRVEPASFCIKDEICLGRWLE